MNRHLYLDACDLRIGETLVWDNGTQMAVDRVDTNTATTTISGITQGPLAPYRWNATVPANATVSILA